MGRLVVQGVIGGVLWVGGGLSWLSCAGSSDGVSPGGRGKGDSRWCLSAGACGGGDWSGSAFGASEAWSRGVGGGGMVWGRHCWWWGGRGRVLCLTGVWASRRVVWVLRVRAVRSLRSLAGCGVEVRDGGGRLGIRVGLWSVGSGWLLVDGACWHGVRVEGMLVVVGCSL